MKNQYISTQETQFSADLLKIMSAQKGLSGVPCSTTLTLWSREGTTTSWMRDSRQAPHLDATFPTGSPFGEKLPRERRSRGTSLLDPGESRVGRGPHSKRYVRTGVRGPNRSGQFFRWRFCGSFFRFSAGSDVRASNLAGKRERLSAQARKEFCELTAEFDGVLVRSEAPPRNNRNRRCLRGFRVQH